MRRARIVVRRMLENEMTGVASSVGARDMAEKPRFG
jgi:hypothetical protein